MKGKGWSRLGAFACALAWAVALGCEEGRPAAQPPEEGDALRALCGRACEELVPCGQERGREEVPDCVERCVQGGAPVARLESCVSCLEETACRGIPVGCQRGPACDMAFDLTVAARSLEAHEGRMARILVAEAVEGEHWVDAWRDVRIEGGGFEVRLPGVLPDWGIPFDVRVVVDADGDDACGDGDRHWRFDVGRPEGDLRLVVDGAGTAGADACPFWSAVRSEVVLEGEGFHEWEGKSLIAAPVWVGRTFLSIGLFASTPIVDGSFRVALGEFGDFVEGMAPGSEIRLAWMVDLDGDWICSDADAGGSGLVPPVEREVQRVEARPTPEGSAPCELLRGMGHDVRVVGGGYGGFEGEEVEAALLDEGEKVVAWTSSKVVDGSFELLFQRVGVPGRTYSAAFWIDRDDDRSCEGSNDRVWLAPLGTVGEGLEAAAPFADEVGGDELCAHFDRSIRGG